MNVRTLKLIQVLRSRSVLVVPFLSGIILSLAGDIYGAGWEYISATRVHGLLNEGSGMWLLDVRGAAAFDKVHIEGAMNVPSAEIKVKKFPQQKMLVLTDDSIGLRSAIEAAADLTKEGYKKVYVLEGGILGWEAENYPLVGIRDAVKLVTVEELRWAIERKIRVNIYDLRDEQDIKKTGVFPGGEILKGSDLKAKIANFEKILKKNEKKGIAEKLNLPTPVVLILPQGLEPDSVLAGIGKYNVDVRYLDGGYESWISKKETKTVGSCPVCSAKKRRA